MSAFLTVTVKSLYIDNLCFQTLNSNFNDPDCTPLSSLEHSQLASVIAAIVVTSLALGFLLFIFYLTCREAKTVKYNIRRLSDIERESFSKRRTSQGGALEPPKPSESRRVTLDDLYDSILPQYTDAFANDDVELETSTQETQRIGSVAWQLEEDPDPDEQSEDPEVVLRKLFFPAEFSNPEDSRQRMPTDGANSATRRKTASYKQRVKRSFHQVSNIFQYSTVTA